MKIYQIKFRKIVLVLGMSLYLAVMSLAFQNCSRSGFAVQQFDGLSSTQAASSVDVDPTNDGDPQEDKSGFATLTWDANSEIDLKEYRIYYGTNASNLNQVVSKIGLTATPNTPEVTLNGLTRGTKYYFAVTAVSQSGQESERSDISDKTP